MQSLCFDVVTAGFNVRCALDKVLRPYDLTTSSYNYLETIYKSKTPIMTTRIKLQATTPAPDTTRLINRLFRNGYIERFRDEKTDRRTVLIAVTPKGANTYRDATSSISAVVGEIASRFIPDHLKTSEAA